MSGDVHTSSKLWRDDNCRTRVPTFEELARSVPALSPKVAFVAAYGRMAELARHLPGRSFVVVAVDPIGRVAGSAVLGDRQRIVVGRHTECDLRLELESVSLRHVAALLRHDADGPALHVWDLATGSRFHTEEGAAERALVSTGPLYVVVEGYAIWFVPTGGAPRAWPESAEAAFDALPPRTFVRSEESPAPKAPPAAAPEGYRVAARRGRDRSLLSLVTGVAPPCALDEDDRGSPHAVLALETELERKRYELSAERLARGVLLGRYVRCDLLPETPGVQISRVHALLVRLGEETWILDTASTNGTCHGGAKIAARVLEDGDRLTLAGELHVEWRRVARAPT